TVNFIKEHQELLTPPNWRDRGTKLLRYLADVIVNGNEDVKFIDDRVQFLEPKVPAFDDSQDYAKGSKDRLNEMGPRKFAQWLKDQKQIQYTDTTFRDGHQSLLATRMRSIDMLKVAESYARHHGADLFSMEVWGGATFDVSMRFLKEDPWKRLANFRKKMPNVLLQMLLRGSNAVGYKAYPDNLVEEFIVQAAETGIDVFRIFDSLNWIDAMKVSIRTVLERTNSIAEACVCYTGDITDPDNSKFTLQYYLDLARQLEDEGVHIIAIKDMAGLLKPLAAEQLITELKKVVDLPIHLHTHGPQVCCRLNGTGIVGMQMYG
ncbi:MAG: pyruvate carboxylase, partial [Bacteroidota bacterium]